jgi:hypothetical protein
MDYCTRAAASRGSDAAWRRSNSLGRRAGRGGGCGAAASPSCGCNLARRTITLLSTAADQRCPREQRAAVPPRTPRSTPSTPPSPSSPPHVVSTLPITRPGGAPDPPPPHTSAGLAHPNIQPPEGAPPPAPPCPGGRQHGRTRLAVSAGNHHFHDRLSDSMTVCRLQDKNGNRRVPGRVRLVARRTRGARAHQAARASPACTLPW